MLIITEGWQNYELRHKLRNPDIDNTPTRRESGHPVTEVMDGRKGYEGEEPRWILPPEFCADCGRTDIVPQYGMDGKLRNQNLGMFRWEHQLPEIDYHPGDAVIYHTCHHCGDRAAWGNGFLLPHAPSRGELERRRRERVERHVIEYIKAERLRGGEHPALGSYRDQTRD